MVTILNLLHSKICLYFVCLYNFVSTLGFSDEKNTMATISSTETVVASCSLKIRINPLRITTSSSTPKALVEVTLAEQRGESDLWRRHRVNGNSRGLFYAIQSTVQDSSSNGATSDAHSCFITGEDGKALIDLINIPYNTAVRVKASYDCGDYTIRATGNVIISKKVIHKK